MVLRNGHLKIGYQLCLKEEEFQKSLNPNSSSHFLYLRAIQGDEPDNEEETCLLLREPGKAIIDTGCGRCVIGAVTLEAYQSVIGGRIKEITWQHDAPSVVFYYGKGTKDRIMGVIDLPCVVGGQNTQIRMHVVPGKVPCLLSKVWLKENGAVLNTSSEELVLTKK